MSDGARVDRRSGLPDLGATGFKHEIAADVAISGKINFPGDARIDGRLRGEVRADALLVVGESGVLHADVRARHLVVLGTLQGNVQRTHRVELFPGSHLVGSVEAESLVVHPGATLHGRCRIGPSRAGSPGQPNVILLERPIQAGAAQR